MTPSSKPKGHALTLSVSFDINQLGPSLVWHFDEDVAREEIAAGRRNPISKVGPHAGSVHMFEGDRIYVAFTAFSGPAAAGAPAEPFEKIKVVDCVMQTVPHLRQQDCYYGPSPFHAPHSDDVSPSVRIIGWEMTQPIHFDKRHGAYALRMVSSEPIPVLHAYGIWEMSLVLTVDIWHAKGTALVRRVFRFDPDGEVGTGTTKNL